MKKIGILGSTGSIGTQVLDLIAKSDQFNVSYLSAYSNVELLIEQTKTFKPSAICIVDKSKVDILKNALNSFKIEILSGNEGILELASRDNIDLLLNALVGYSGVFPTIKAIEAGIDIALANKESLVVGGSIIKDLILKNNTKIYPVDSEHSAIWQCLLGEKKESVHKLILTGSGGPFRTLDYKEFKNIKKEQALKHPNWSMGNKISIDSATMMNKGLEVIEAYWLFDLAIDQIDIIIHPQSIIHSMVEFIDGSIKAQLGTPNMTIPIHFALNYPNRTFNDSFRFNFLEAKDLTFEKPDFNKFKCIKLAYQALESSDSYPIVLNVANDICVEAFLNNKIKFIDIPSFIEDALSHHDKCTVDKGNMFSIIDKTKQYINNKIGNK